ncbi:transposase, partial [Burkholderia multivorans]|uniref:transposase n=1 Tax=Burkholderia multivorans TaxID=87883 RepID=UPI0037351300
VQDILIAVVDGLKGFPEAINTVFPETTVQTCIVHLIRNSLDFASWKDRKSVASGLSGILCLRHNMLPRRVYASQTESPAGGTAGDSGRAARAVRQ